MTALSSLYSISAHLPRRPRASFGSEDAPVYTARPSFCKSIMATLPSSARDTQYPMSDSDFFSASAGGLGIRGIVSGPAAMFF